jgi:hypothetical protein
LVSFSSSISNLISDAYAANSKSTAGFGNVGDNDQKSLSCNCVMKVTSPFSFSIHLQPVTTLALTDTEQTSQNPSLFSSTLERVIFSILMNPLKNHTPPTSLPG